MGQTSKIRTENGAFLRALEINLMLAWSCCGTEGGFTEAIVSMNRWNLVVHVTSDSRKEGLEIFRTGDIVVHNVALKIVVVHF